MAEPIAYLVAERRNGWWLLTDEFTERFGFADKAEAVAVAARWRAAGTDAGVFAVVPVDEAVA